jgi:O-antigen/teichoic acid export membrane protein
VLRPAFFLLALLAAWAANYRLEATVAMAMQLGAGCLVMIIVSVAWYRFRPSGMVKAIPAYAPRQWVGACLPMGATEGLRLLQRQGAILLLGLLATSRETGLYRVADNLVLVTTLGQAVLAIAAAPHFARLHAIGEKEQLQRILSVTALAMTISTIALGLPVVFLGRNLLALLFGDEFRASYLPFAIAWLALVVSGGFGPVQAFANMAGQQKLVTVGFLISVSTNVMVSVFTIPRLGAIGAALGLLAGVCLSNAWLWRKVLMHEGLDSSVFSRSALRLLSPKQIRHYAQLIRRGQ